MPGETRPNPMQAQRRLLDERKKKLCTLRLALIEGEQSGVAGPLDMDRIKQEARDEARRTP